MNKHLFKFLLAGFLLLAAAIVNALLALLQLEPTYSFMPSVSWNG